jgi:predicted nucleic acid-binding protein
MIFLDTNVFLYAAGGEHRLREPARRILRLLEAGTLAATTSVEVVQELTFVLWRRGLHRQGRELARIVLRLFPAMLPLTRADLELALSVLDRSPSLTPRDAVHVATMRRHGIDTIASADRHFDDVSGIRRIDLAEVRG